MYFLSTPLAPRIVCNGASFFERDFFKNRNTKVSEQGLAALGSPIKDMKSLTSLSLDFGYFFKDNFSSFQTHLRAVFLFEFEFCIFYPLC